MRHVLFALALLLYVLVLGQNWGAYTAALMAAVYVRNGGRWFAPADSARFDAPRGRSPVRPADLHGL